MKSEYERELEKRLAALETNYGYLKQKVDDLEHDEDLEEKLDRARKRLGELKDLGEGAWEEVRDKAESAWKDVESSFQKLKARLK